MKKRKYPFIKTELVRAGSSKLLNKILAETKAKRYLVDVIQISGFQAYPLKKRNLFLQYVPNESRVYQKGFKDPDGHWTSLYLLPYVMGYNTRLLSPSDIPDTYEGFLDPKWKGKKIGFDTQEVEWFANMLEIMGKEKGLEFMRKFSAQNLAYRLGHTLIAQLVIAGEFPIATVYPQGVEEKKKLGAPIEWVGTKPVIVKLSAIGIYSHAPNPNAAKLYIDFSLSREGQMIIKSLGRVPARPDVEVEYKKKLEGISLYPSDLSMAEKYVEYYRQFKDIFKF